MRELDSLAHVLHSCLKAYIKWGKVNVSIPEGEVPDKITLNRAVELLATKAGSKKGKKGNKKIGTQHPQALTDYFFSWAAPELLVCVRRYSS